MSTDYEQPKRIVFQLVFVWNNYPRSTILASNFSRGDHGVLINGVGQNNKTMGIGSQFIPYHAFRMLEVKDPEWREDEASARW